MSATVRLNAGTALAFDPVRSGHRQVTQGVCLSIEGSTPGQVLNCAVIPLDKVGAVIASLELADRQARAS